MQGAKKQKSDTDDPLEMSLENACFDIANEMLWIEFEKRIS